LPYRSKWSHKNDFRSEYFAALAGEDPEVIGLRQLLLHGTLLKLRRHGCRPSIGRKPRVKRPRLHRLSLWGIL
jgi:hypothetical protein